MDCNIETPTLDVEIGDTVYGIEFGQIQIEITGLCNMKCQHCRASNQPKEDMEIDHIVKIIKFARQFSPNYKEIVVSGGEPTLHRNFSNVLEAVRKNGGDFVTLTTNGSLFNSKHLHLIECLDFKRFVLSVSIDSLDAKEHDVFRGHPGAFDKATRALSLIAESSSANIIASMRSTIKASQIDDMESMAEYAKKIGCQRISFSAIHPAGRAIDRPDLWMSSDQKLTFLKNVYSLKEKFPEMNITTNDPLKCLLRGKSDVGKNDELVFDGCGAAAITFNVNADGVMTPCALLDVPMMNTKNLSIKEITEEYRKNEIVKNMLVMKLGGKCGTCPSKYQCGGCRARALIQNGDMFAEDPHCWINQ